MLTVNEYFNGHVKSIALQTSTLPATVGVMSAGEYEFDTSQKEHVTIVSGSMDIKLPGEHDYQTVHQGSSFNVSANVTFHVKVAADVAYFCTYG